MEKQQEPAKKTPAEMAEACMQAVSNTEDFLDQLRQIGKYDFRKKIHLSDVELTEYLDGEITKQLVASREYYLMFMFLQGSNLFKKYAAFRGEVIKAMSAKMEALSDDHPA